MNEKNIYYHDIQKVNPIFIITYTLNFLKNTPFLIIKLQYALEKSNKNKEI